MTDTGGASYYVNNNRARLQANQIRPAPGKVLNYY